MRRFSIDIRTWTTHGDESECKISNNWALNTLDAETDWVLGVTRPMSGIEILTLGLKLRFNTGCLIVRDSLIDGWSQGEVTTPSTNLQKTGIKNVNSSAGNSPCTHSMKLGSVCLEIKMHLLMTSLNIMHYRWNMGLLVNFQGICKFHAS